MSVAVGGQGCRARLFTSSSLSLGRLTSIPLVIGTSSIQPSTTTKQRGRREVLALLILDDNKSDKSIASSRYNLFNTHTFFRVSSRCVGTRLCALILQKHVLSPFYGDSTTLEYNVLTLSQVAIFLYMQVMDLLPFPDSKQTFLIGRPALSWNTHLHPENSISRCQLAAGCCLIIQPVYLDEANSYSSLNETTTSN